MVWNDVFYAWILFGLDSRQVCFVECGTGIITITEIEGLTYTETCRSSIGVVRKRLREAAVGHQCTSRTFGKTQMLQENFTLPSSHQCFVHFQWGGLSKKNKLN